ncbi:hypothetical protein PHSY_004036 [Pseudozyma hubeiensis SY62]|uniref:Uncharacterized protein n=1 Tax=Pseudozyma hubeiensis (strain SY62) TaxID=1305764 RepID=R9P521_PSEHS|nr:hypothetical protein PHSY_004036 [Pseudozyma hubeiensis SY62]GAC96456.1 hypothetical protein PHSY_004036 [Pseudozyma hubeiensis SY62]
MRVLLFRRRETEGGSACVSRQSCIPAELPWLADSDMATDFFPATVSLTASCSALRFLHLTLSPSTFTSAGSCREDDDGDGVPTSTVSFISSRLRRPSLHPDSAPHPVRITSPTPTASRVSSIWIDAHPTQRSASHLVLSRDDRHPNGQARPLHKPSIIDRANAPTAFTKQPHLCEVPTALFFCWSNTGIDRHEPTFSSAAAGSFDTFLPFPLYSFPPSMPNSITRRRSTRNPSIDFVIASPSSLTFHSTAMTADTPRDRGDQILSAKKKLKSYRAKQALMAQKRSSASLSHSRSASGVRISDTPPATAVAEALSNEIVSQASTSAASIGNTVSPHTRTPSRSGHARGHSRAGSISITPNALFSQAQAIASVPAPLTASALGRPASIVAPSAAAHTRTHSRSHSRSYSRSRPVSISLLGAKKEEPVVVAIEHPAESETPIDMDGQRRSQQFLDSSSLFGGPVTPVGLRPSSTASSKRLSNVSPSSALFPQSNTSALSPSPSTPAARHSRRLSRHARTPSVSTKRESMEIMGGLGAGLGLDMTNTASDLHSAGAARRRSSRMSNLPSASVLFGSSDPASLTTNRGSSSSNINNNLNRSSSRMSGQQWDWRKAIADAADQAEESSQDRLTALEKLEGRASAAHIAKADRPSSAIVAASRASRRLSGHTRTESIQIPNLDEIHQNELNERRASWTLQASDGNTNTLASASTPMSAPATSTRRESWGRGLVAPSPSSLLSAGFSSPALPSTYLSSPGRPESMIVCAESPHPEGLGTLMEEEEEEDVTSPTRERPSLDMAPLLGNANADDELRKQRREAQDETAKRNRRASLAPKPLKLKSRPPSLYLTPLQRNGLVSSPSMPNFPTSPQFAPSIADETTPRASAAALPEAAEDDESQILEMSKDSDVSTTLPSRSTTCPDLSSLAIVSEDQVAAPVSDDSPGSTEQSRTSNDADSPVEADLSAEQMATQEQRQLEELQQQILRAHRHSMIASASATPSSNEATSASSGSTASARQGMRALRLGSQANLSSIMEASSATSPASAGVASGAVAATATTAAQRRRSLIMGPASAAPVSNSSSRDNDFVPSFGSSAASSRAARRSSIIYKPSTASVPEAQSPHSASDSIVGLGGVPLAVHDELKAKANRDAALLESTKKQVEMLERELAHETARSAREKAELEQWNMDKEEHLFDRAQRAETAARQAEDAVAAMRVELDQAKEHSEDLQAEREVLQDDIEGWRSRCQDLEKTLRTERARSDENRKLRAAARLRIKQLTDFIEQSSGSVPTDELGVLAALEMPQLDLAAALKSPGLGALSPNPNATPKLSPTIGGDEVPPQITKLLGDMRQQIFNLAGSLEHERKQHLHAKEEVARLQRETEEQQQSAVRDELEAEGNQEEASTSAEGADAAAADRSFPSPDESRDLSTSGSFSSVRRSSGMLGKNKRHVFAYDSSMGSFGQSQSSASLSMMTMTDDTIHTDNESDMGDSFSAKLPSSESDLIGLGMGSLQTLDEIEEVSELSESVADSNGTLSAAVATSPAWVDIEAGAGEAEVDAARPSLDVSESSFDAHFQDAENAPPTPDLYRSTEPAFVHATERFVKSNVADSTEHSTNASSSSSSGESHAAPPTPPQHAARLGDAPVEADFVMRTPSPRPEFHREWSFEWGKSRSRKVPSTQHTVEDFFGILSEDRLPPLSTSEEAMDLPPITLSSNGTLLPTARLNKDGKPVFAGAATSRSASIFGGKRPPVARSAYLRESFDSTSNANLAHHQHAQSGGIIAGYGHESQSSSASSLVASIGSRALSRMSLQHLTGAFSGLSGYLTNQSGAAVTAAKMCNAAGMEEGNSGLNWAAAQRRTLDEEDEDAFDAKNLRFDIESSGGGAGRIGKYDRGSAGKQQLSWVSESTMTKQQQQQQASSSAKRYVRKSAVAVPKATPVWLLDFSTSTAVGTGPTIVYLKMSAFPMMRVVPQACRAASMAESRVGLNMRLPQQVRSYYGKRIDPRAQFQAASRTTRPRIFTASAPASSSTVRMALLLGSGGLLFATGLNSFTSAPLHLDSARPYASSPPITSPTPPTNTTTEEPESIVNIYQLSFGTVCGICAGVFIKKGLKFFAFLFGGCYILLQYMSSQSLIKVNWSAINSKYDRLVGSAAGGNGAQQSVKGYGGSTAQRIWNRTTNFLVADFQPRATFMAGLLLGLRLG